MSNEWDREKTLGDMIEQRYWGENGVYTGTASNQLGLEAHRRREEASKKERESWNSSSSKDTSSKVICTELVRQGYMTRADLLIGARYFEERLSERHIRGYHSWAVAAVQGMRKSPLQTAFWRPLAQARADAIAARYGEKQRGGFVKSVILHSFNALCWIVGGFAREQDWRRLYDGDVSA